MRIKVRIGSPEPMPTGYFVSPTGNDSNPGTEAQPFLTIQKAADVVNPGETVIVEDGTYIYTGSGSGVNRYIVDIARGGTANNFVTFKSRNRWGARLDGQGTIDTGFKLRVPYVRIEGFEIFNLVSNGGSSTGVEVFTSTTSFVEVIGNYIHHIGRQCSDSTNGFVGVFVSRPNVLVEGNLIHDIGRYEPNEEGCQPGQPYYQNNDHGIYITSNAADVTVRNNVFYNNLRGWAIQIYSGTLARINVFNNTFSGTNTYRDGHITITDVTLSDSKIQNNIFYQPRALGVRLTGTLSITTTVISYNMTDVSQMVNTTPSGLTVSNNLLSTNPLLVNPGAQDFHLQSNSPAIDAGLSIDVPFDFDRNSRPQGSGIDIGAFEAG